MRTLTKLAWLLPGLFAIDSASARVLMPLDEPALARAGAAAEPPLPELLSETGLYADASVLQIDPAHFEFSPQYPLWSDGVHKQRWISLPAGGVIDASDPDAWVFPIGTRLWKQFSLAGRRLETRYSERLPDGRWRFVAYVWNAEGTAARLAPEFGSRIAHAQAPGGSYVVPSRYDCLACHAGALAPVLGFSALQLSSDRDPLAPHADAVDAAALDLPALLARGLVVNLPNDLQTQPPRIESDDPLQRAALGYLHGNCGHCHHQGEDAVPVKLELAHSLSADRDPKAALRSLVEQARYRPRGWVGEARLLVPGDADASVMLHRMRSREPNSQMPPLGTQRIDAEALALIERWIAQATPTATQGAPE
jgi:hypothetical protein